MIFSFDPDALVEAQFDLFEAIEKSRKTYDKNDKDLIKTLTLYGLPKYVRANLDREIAGKEVSHEESRWCCIQFGVRRLFADERFQEWEELHDLANSRESHFKNDGDWDDVQERLTRFPFKPHDCYTGTYTTNARIPEPIRAQVTGAAKILGMSASTVATICFIDALRDLDHVMHRKDMDNTIEQFYSLLKRRTQRVRNLLVEVGAIQPRRVP